MPWKAGWSWKKIPGRRRIVSVRKSSDTSGSATAVLGTIFAGRARKSYVSGASKMLAMTVLEYRSLTCAGSKPVSATRKA